ncbi:hypothetical protein ABTM42_19665, partial [Acinetobacter baumannii]
FSALGLRPLSPVRLRASRSPSGDINLSWIRRTRIGGDSWDLAEVPLSEASEAYQVQVLSGASVVRTLSSSAPQVTYPADQQVSDFGSVQPAISV